MNTRPRGPRTDWRPQRATLGLLEQVAHVLAEYSDHLPLTLRQVFYRLVAEHGFDKTERSYERLLDAMGNARRAGIIPFDSIRDDGITDVSPSAYSGKEHFLEVVQGAASRFRLNRQVGQAATIEVWCEAAGMVPQLVRVADPYGISVYSSSGFPSITAKHQAAERVRDEGAVIFLHIGDHDPSGVHVFSSFEEDVTAWVDSLGGFGLFERVAVTPAQVDAYDLATAPAKKTDRRSFDGETCQAEALGPDVLAAILTTAIESHFDLTAYREILRDEDEQRAELMVEVDAMLLRGRPWRPR